MSITDPFRLIQLSCQTSPRAPAPAWLHHRIVVYVSDRLGLSRRHIRSSLYGVVPLHSPGPSSVSLPMHTACVCSTSNDASAECGSRRPPSFDSKASAPRHCGLCRVYYHQRKRHSCLWTVAVDRSTDRENIPPQPPLYSSRRHNPDSWDLCDFSVEPPQQTHTLHPRAYC